MRVVSASLTYPHVRRVGAEVALHALNQHLLAAGVDVQAVTTQLVPKTVLDGVHVRTGVHPRPPADVVIVNAGAAGQARTWWPAARLVVWVHNAELPTLMDLRAALARGNVDVVSNTEVTRTVLLHSMGVDSTVLHPPVPHADAVEGGDAITLVNCTRDKGSDVFYALADANPDREFLAVLGGYGDQDVRDLPNVTVHPHGDLDDVWAHTQVLLVPSVRESYSMVAVEAATRGIPVLASDLPGIREAVGDGAVYTRGDWDAALAEVDARWEDLSDAGRLHAACTDTAGELDAFTDLVLRSA